MQDFKRNHRKVTECIIFFYILILLFALISTKTEEALLKSDRLVPVRNKNIYRIQREPENSIDIIVLGDSLSYSAITPMRLWKNHGYTSYVCGQSGQRIDETEEMLNISLKTQSPEIVILETNTLFDSKIRSVKLNSSLEAMLNYYLPVFRGHDVWKSLIMKKEYIIVLLGIRKKMSYISELSREVELIEGGNLNCPITVTGRDELAMLAEGLENMRTSFIESQKKEQEIVQKNQRVITEMSHDLRTPITVIILYTEILKAGKYKDKAQELEYVEKINQKAQQIRQRTDRLLEYSITAENHILMGMETDSFACVFFDLLSENCEYLEQKGFKVDAEVNWSDGQIRFNADYTMRVIDNIVSNIEKYANPDFPVIIRSTERLGSAGLLFQNTVMDLNEAKYGTGIGIQSVGNMMKEMNGICRSGYAGRKYWIEIHFPLD